MAMPNVAISDGKATPVVHTFAAQSGQQGNSPAIWFNKIAGFSSLAWERLSTLVTLSDKPKGMHRATAQIHLPVVRVVDGSELLDGTMTAFITIQCPANLATDVNLKDLKTLSQNFLANAVAAELFNQLKPSTSV